MKQVTCYIDNTLAALYPSLVEQQAAYYAANGIYYQMLWSHTAAPSEPTAPDNMATNPVREPPAVVSGLPALMRARIRIDTYGDPEGWMLTLEAIIDGEVWRRVADCGVHPEWSQSWAVVVNPPDQVVTL